MNPERWRQVDRISAFALGRPIAERSALLDKACGGDDELRREVESLIAHSQVEGFMERPAAVEAALLVAEVAADRLSGQTIGQYQILRQLGAGGTGEVYLAHDTRLNRPVTIKVLSSRLTTDAERVRRFRQEALAASALNHPNIITVYDTGQENDTHFIAAEFIAGETLRQRMSRSPLELDETLEIAVQTAAALTAAHKAKIVHRDIKPENIMLRSDDGLVKVLDFGLAKPTETGGAELSSGAETPTRTLTHTAPGVVMGTVAYMSPEQARGLPVDERTDIWSLGALLYEMVARCLPYPGGSADEIIAAILSKKQPPPLSDYSDNIPERLEEIVAKALTKDRERRYQSAKDLQIDLERLRRRLGTQTDGALGVTRGRTDAARHMLNAGHPARGFRKYKLAVALTLLALLITVAAFAYYSYPAEHTREITSIAILPFVNAGGDPETEYLADGISESLLNSLSRLPQLKVTARSSSFRFRGRETDPREVARALGVQAVVTGRFVQRGDQLQLSAELVDVRDDRHVWGERYERKVSDLLSVQREIAKEITNHLRLNLSGTEQGRVAKNYTESPEAYQLYLKGRFYWNKRTEKGVREGIGYFQQAIERDPNYAPAYVGLSDSYQLLGISEALTGVMSPKEAIPKARAAAEKALEIDDGLPEAHASLAQNRWQDWDWVVAQEEFARSFELNPNYATAHHWYALNLLSLGRMEEAQVEIKRAQELEPLSLAINANVGMVLYTGHRYDEAIEQCLRTIDMDPTFALAHYRLGIAYVQKGMYGEAVSALQQAITYSNKHPTAISALGHAYAVAGHRGEARRVLAELRALSERQYVSQYDIALIYVGLGDEEQSLKLLEEAYEQHDFILRMNLEPRLDRLRPHPRFQEILRKIELTQSHAASGAETTGRAFRTPPVR